jgi:guanine deaminase
MPEPEQQTIHRGHIFHVAGAPGFEGADRALVEIEDGALLVGTDGVILALGPFGEARTQGTRVVEHGGRYILPGLIDTHVHYPQLPVVASPNKRLLEWLDKYVFPAEARLRDLAHARRLAEVFVDELIRNGTTTAMVFGVSFPEATRALFARFKERGLRGAIGRVSMDEGPPSAEPLLFNPDECARLDEELIREWHPETPEQLARARLFVALEPRFAPSCSPALLDKLAVLQAKHSRLGVYVTTHWAEDASDDGDVQAARRRHGGSYLSAYAKLLGERTVLAHGAWPDDEEIGEVARAGASVAHCPGSNLFLGSGLMPLRRFTEAGVNVCLGSDLGAGDSLSMLAATNQAYKVQQLLANGLTPAKMLHLATLAGARALRLDHRIGNLDPGKEADFIVLDPSPTPLLRERLAGAQPGRPAEERLFALLMLAGRENVAEVYVGGRRLHPPA